MDRSDVHLGQPRNVAKGFVTPSNDSILELSGRLVGEREGDDVAGSEPSPRGSEEVNYPPGDDLGLAGAGAGNELQVTALMGNRIALIRC